MDPSSLLIVWMVNHLSRPNSQKDPAMAIFELKNFTKMHNISWPNSLQLPPSNHSNLRDVASHYHTMGEAPGGIGGEAPIPIPVPNDFMPDGGQEANSINVMFTRTTPHGLNLNFIGLKSTAIGYGYKDRTILEFSPLKNLVTAPDYPPNHYPSIVINSMNYPANPNNWNQYPYSQVPPLQPFPPLQQSQPQMQPWMQDPNYPYMQNPYLLYQNPFLEDIACKNDDGRSVDWWIVYKLPSGVLNGLNGMDSGDIYGYITSGDADKSRFKLSTRDIRKRDNIFVRTLEPIYRNPNKTSFMFYNDQYGERIGGSKGLSRGVLAYSNISGFWITHSISEFVPDNLRIRQRYEFPENERGRGQIAICLSVPFEEITNIAKQLQVLRPNVYEAGHLEDEDLKNIIGLSFVDPVDIQSRQIKTKEGVEFQSFAKSPTRKSDLYRRINEEINADLDVQTFRSPRGIQTSDCNEDRRIRNVVSIYMPYGNTSDWKETAAWSPSKDNGKWAISESDKEPHVCISELNRNENHLIDGGRAICFKDPGVWKAFRSTIKDFEQCPRASTGPSNRRNR